MAEDDWVLFLSSLESEVFDAFMNLVTTFEVHRDLADSFRPLALGHISQHAEPPDHHPLVGRRQRLDQPGESVQCFLNRAA